VKIVVVAVVEVVVSDALVGELNPTRHAFPVISGSRLARR
jgi:hypothetical protein